MLVYGADKRCLGVSCSKRRGSGVQLVHHAVHMLGAAQHLPGLPQQP